MGKTPEIALKTAAQNAMPMEENALTVKVHLDTYYLSDHAVVFMYRKTIPCALPQSSRTKRRSDTMGDTQKKVILLILVTSCLMERKIRSCFSPFTLIKKPKSLRLEVYRWEGCSYQRKINREKTYTAELSDQRWKIDYWWCDDVEESSADAIVLQFAH